ncbi:MAG: glycosyltransferase family 2 protein [Actinomycetota bacterium]|nr:glycosyltransferase family 2 protein [Actinomycetota bacterium]
MAMQRWAATGGDPEVPGPEVTVIITNHNYGRFLADAVASARSDRQGVHMQIVVVDDGSDDNSSQILDSMEPDVRVIRQGNVGQGAAMNAGFRACGAPLVMFLDADDTLLEGTGAAVVQAFARHPGVARVHFGLRCIDAEGEPTGQCLPEPGRSLPDGDLRALVLSTPDDIAWQPTSGNAFAADTLRRILPMPEAPYRIAADHYLSNLSALLGEVRDLGRDGANYRIHGDNADYRDRADLPSWTRRIIERTIVTHQRLHALADDLHLHFPDDPLSVPSVTFIANRLFSLRADPAGHPVPVDRRFRLARAGMQATLARRDLTRARRVAGVLWFAAMAISPRRIVTPLARRVLTR